MKSVYLAGPDVFYPNSDALAVAHKALCREYGLEPLHPIDQPTLASGHIYQTNIELLKRANAVVANLNPFRGAEVDSGTAFEVGFAIASGKPVIGYIAQSELLKERVERMFGPLSMTDSIRRDKEGNLVENFGHQVNLMLAESCIIVHGGLEDALKKLANLTSMAHAVS